MFRVEEFERDLADWRHRRRERVAGPEGWLTVVGLAWLRQGSNPVGAEPSNAVVLPGGPDRAGTIEVRPGGVTFAGKDGQRRRLEHDPDSQPTIVRFGPISFFVMERQGRLAVRIRDRESPARTAFHGLEYFPANQAWRVDASFVPYEPAGSIMLPTVLGGEERYGLPGQLVFDAAGATHSLDAYEEPGERDLFVMFGDLTNGAESFGGGRYMYVPRPEGDGRVVLDFNRCYNPPCVFATHTTCALPPPQNRLPLRIEAGEKRYVPTA